MKVKTQKKLIYLRYILPVVIMLCMLLVMLIPSYRYVNVTEGTVEQPVSLWQLMSNSYTATRTVLFGEAEATAQSEAFARGVLTMLICVWVVYLAALGIAIYTAYIALKYFSSDDADGAERMRAIFVTIVPNRFVACATNLFSLALPLFAYFLPLFYTSEKIAFLLFLPDALVVGGVLLLGTFVLSAMCAPLERGFGADVFARRAAFAEDEDIEEEASKPFSDTDDESRERLRRLLLGENENDTDK